MKLQEILFLAIGLTSTLLYARNFFYMMTEKGIILVEPNIIIASSEFAIAVLGTIGLSVMLIRYSIKAREERLWGK